MSQAEIVEFYADLHKRRNHQDIRNFREFLDRLFNERNFEGCTFFTSLLTLCIVRYPTYSEWRFKPLLSLRMASRVNVLIELRITQATKPALRAITESSSAPYEFALEEFDRLYAKFLSAHDQRSHGTEYTNGFFGQATDTDQKR